MRGMVELNCNFIYYLIIVHSLVINVPNFIFWQLIHLTITSYNTPDNYNTLAQLIKYDDDVRENNYN